MNYENEKKKKKNRKEKKRKVCGKYTKQQKYVNENDRQIIINKAYKEKIRKRTMEYKLFD